jgi:hypothetical protein
VNGYFFPKLNSGMSNYPYRVHSEMVDFGSGQGRSDVETAGVAALR